MKNQFHSVTIGVGILLLVVSTPTISIFRVLKDAFPLGFSGYVNHEIYADTNQIVGEAVDEYLFFPEPRVFDPDGYDINAKGQLGTATFTTRLRYNKHGSRIGSAEPSAFVEGDFFGNTNLLELGNTPDLLNQFRLRHAFGVLEWGENQDKKFLFGETWHPIYVFNCFPDVISFDGGSPITLFARDPQVTFMYCKPRFDLILSALGQVDFPSLGPTGGRGVYLRRAIVPNLHAQLKCYAYDHYIGLALDFKRLVPRIVTNTNYKAYEHVNSGIASVYCALNGEGWHIWTQYAYAQNANDLGIIGGFAVHTVEPVTDRRTYTPIAINTWWIDTTKRIGEHAEPGLFLGFAKNMGAPKSIIQNITNTDGTIEHTIYSFGETIDILFRIVPRFRYFIADLCIGIEMEYTQANYGTVNNYGSVVATTPARNYRTLLSILYLF